MTSSGITAPEAFGCNTSCLRRTSCFTRGSARSSILDLFHEFRGEHANAAPRLVSLAVLPAQLGVSGFGRGAPSISKRDPSAKIVRASQHVSVSVSNFQVPTCWHEGGSLWREVEPRTRQKNPRAGTQVM